MSRPVLHVLVGPNGAGKSTLYARILRSATHLPFVNADVMLATYPELYADAYAAGDAATEERSALIARRESFVTETVFSHVGKLDLLRDAVAAGYLVHLHVVAIPVDLAVLRVAERVDDGGHDVAETKIRTRYERLWANVAAALPIVRELTVYDNSGRTPLVEIAKFRSDKPVRPSEWPKWAHPDLVALDP